VLAGVLAAVLVLAGAVLSRAFGDAAAGVLLGYAAVPFAALGGAVALGTGRDPADVGAAAVLGGSAAVLVTALLAAVAIAAGVPALVGVAAAALIGLLAAVLDLLAGLTVTGAAAIAVSVVLAVTPLIPAAAFRLAELPLPVVPLTAEELRRDESVVPGPTVLRRTLVADQHVTGLTGATAAVVAGCELLLAREPTGSAPWLLAVVAAATAFRARPFLGRLQRGWLLLAAVTGVVLLAVSLADRHGQAVAVAAVGLPLLVGAGVLVGVALRAGTRVSPLWGRAADLAEGLIVVAIVPLALAVLGLYGYVRGLAG